MGAGHQAAKVHFPRRQKRSQTKVLGNGVADADVIVGDIDFNVDSYFFVVGKVTLNFIYFYLEKVAYLLLGSLMKRKVSLNDNIVLIYITIGSWWR